MPRSLLAFIIAASLGAVVPQYLALGFTHIVPHGLDHVLFILGLFFLSRDTYTLLLQITLFTVAHSLTLCLAMKGLIAVPTAAVEVAIAVSIAFIAVENLFQDRLSRWRPWLVFGFGLIHGLGFAHIFEEVPVEPGLLLPALFSFNLGIELGQIAVVGLAFAVVAAWWRCECYARFIARPCSAMIAVTGMYWAVAQFVT